MTVRDLERVFHVFIRTATILTMSDEDDTFHFSRRQPLNPIKGNGAAIAVLAAVFFGSILL